MHFERLDSKLDPSVNFVHRVGEGQALEARYVRRYPEYLACYLSSQTACKQACRFCHLTFTGQNKERDASLEEILEQAKQVFEHYQTQPKAKVVHYNFMSRGEPLASEVVLWESQPLFERLGLLARQENLLPRFLISTILPKNLEGVDLTNIFPVYQPEIYYSLYSLDKDFRRKWLPRAMDPETALDMLYEWQRHTKKIVRIHYALIKGENDRFEDAADIISAVKDRGLRADFTLVRYNPASDRHGEESDRYRMYGQVLESSIPGTRVKVVDRVGLDVAASCGTFIKV